MNQTLFRHKFLIPDDMVAKLQTKLRSIDATEEHDNEDNVSISSSVSQDKYRNCHHQHQQHHHMHSGHETPKHHMNQSGHHTPQHFHSGQNTPLRHQPG